MENFLNFVTEYYLIFTIISAILLLSLIGYIAEKTSSKDIRIKPAKTKKDKTKKVNMATEETIDSKVDEL